MAGLVLEFKIAQGKENNILIELAKRILSKIDIPSPDSKLMLEYRHFNVIVNELAEDHNGILKSLDLFTKFNPSDYNHMRIRSNLRLNNFEEAKSLCIREIRSSFYIDSSIWITFLEALKNIDDGKSIAAQIFLLIVEKKDLRGAKCAMLELKISYPDAFEVSVSEMLFDFSISLNRKPSTLNDVIFFLKKVQKDEIHEFYSRITEHINSVISIYQSY